MKDALKIVLDKQQITEAIYRYCRAVDRMDRALLQSIWADGAVADYGDAYKGPWPGLVDVIWQIHGGLSAHSHQVTNILIEIDGDRAVSEAYFIAGLRPISLERQRSQINARGRYLDRWIRADERWLISHRTVALDFSDVTAVGPEVSAANGVNNNTDPSYDLFR